jgi:hypothetical protein
VEVFDPQGLKPETPHHGLKNRGLRRAEALSCQKYKTMFEKRAYQPLVYLQYRTHTTGKQSEKLSD